jgi:uncharacterized protein YndB with AHSA1/START domain
MPDILNRVEVRSSANEVYRALTTLDGLSGWWTTDTKGGTAIGSVIKFTFGTRGFFDMKVLELEPGKRVLWQVVDGPEDWVGTKIAFDLKQDNDSTVILFKHQGWKEQSEFMHHCSTKWAMFLMSLKSLLETGKGTPFPNDVHITVNWD